MGERSERVQAIIDLPSEDFEEAVASLLEASGEKARERFRALLAEDEEDRRIAAREEALGDGEGTPRCTGCLNGCRFCEDE